LKLPVKPLYTRFSANFRYSHECSK